MAEQKEPTEKEQKPLDISSRVASVIDDPEVIFKTSVLADLLQGLRREPALTLTMNWRGLDWAKWVKSFVEKGAWEGQERTAVIRCTESQKKEAANAFASGVKWINSEEEK